MVVVATYIYDGGAAGGDGNLTQTILQVDASIQRIWNATYDFRDRIVSNQGPVNYFAALYYDNLDRITKAESYDTVGPTGSSSSSSSSSRSSGSTTGNLIGRTQWMYDSLSQIYQTISYAVDPTTGLVGNSLTDNSWFDATGNLVKSYPAGASIFRKTTIDSLGRATIRYTCYGPDASYSDAFSVVNNTVIEQSETKYDTVSNVIQTTNRVRYHNAAATQLGQLQNPSVTPNARVSYVALYPDPIGRIVNSADYGTNAGVTMIRPSTAPARSDTILVNSTSFDSTGMVYTTTDPAGIVTLFLYDAAGRSTEVIENFVQTSSSSSSSSWSSSSSSSSASSSSSSGTSACSSSDDTNRITQFTYNADGLLAAVVAQNSRTGNQTTTYVYGSTIPQSSVVTTVFLQYVDYPDSTGGSDRVSYTYNRLGQQTSVTDQRNCVHTYAYDLLGRLANDCVTTLGTGVDAAVRQFAYAYDVRGMVNRLTSYDNSLANQGNIVNDVQLAYNTFAQIGADAQSHSGAVVPGTTPTVQYGYYNGSTNTIRPQTLIYPNGRAITIGYGTSGGINDAASRVDNLTDSTTLVNYTYLGLGNVVTATNPQPSIQYTLLGSSSGNSPAGDIYWGLDLFSRIIDSRWYNMNTSADLDRIKYGYDRASNRIWRQNPVATTNGANFDEYYTNDGLERLKSMQRGTLNANQTAITSPSFSQCWTLDPTGNWRGFNESTNGTSWTTVQNRAANTINEITSISNTVGTAWAIPVYDAAGNMTTIPQPANPGIAYAATYDAWNRLVKLVDSSSNNTVQQNQYDARGFRTEILSYTAGVLTESRHCYYSNDWRNLEERLGVSTTADRQFIWGVRYIDDMVLRDRGSERFYAAKEANWNITAIIDTTGTVQERYAYSEYGAQTFLSGTFLQRSLSSYNWETLFRSYRFDNASQMQHVRYRFYNSLVGNWIQRDPNAYVDGASLYAAYFVPRRNDPMGAEASQYPWGFIGPLPAGECHQPPIFGGLKADRLQKHDDLIVKLVKDFNANKAKYCGCSEAQAAKIPDLDTAFVKSWILQESGGTPAAWDVDPAQVNNPQDWTDAKTSLGLKKNKNRNEGNLEDNLKAALGFLCRKGFGKSGKPVLGDETRFFDGWRTALTRYNANTRMTENGKPHVENYVNQIFDRAENPGKHYPIELPRAQ
jgi:YD repeat-containing protein